MYARIQVVFGGHDSFREALIVEAADFIGVKSFKAKGKRLTTFQVDRIEELEPTRMPEPEDSAEDLPEETDNGTENPEEEDGQMKLF